MKVVCLSALLVAVFSLSFSSELWTKKETIKLVLNRGTHYVYATTLENKLDQKDNPEGNVEQIMTLTIDHHVIDRLNNGNYLIETSYKSFSLIMKTNRKVLTYHSDTIDVMNPFYKQLKFLTTLKLSYEVSPEGVVRNLKGFENMKKYTDEDDKIASLLRSFGSERFITEMYNYIPAQPVQLNETWKAQAVLPDLMDLKYDVNYSLKETSAKSLKLGLESEFEMVPAEQSTPSGKYKIEESGSQNGELLIDPSSGMRLSSVMDQLITINVFIENPKPDEKKTVPMKIISRARSVLLK
jgi:hypothetical protein